MSAADRPAETTDPRQVQAEAAVRMAYQTILMRQPDPRGLEGAARTLLAGTGDFAALLERLLRSDEFARDLPKFIAHYVKPDKVPPFNHVSQNGESWTLVHAMLNAGARHRIMVDVGARGRLRSNSFDLLRHFGWRGVLIEANPDLAKTIQAEFAGLDMELVSCAISDTAGEAPFYIGRNPDRSSLIEAKAGELARQISVTVRPLSKVLRERHIPVDFDVLSLDINSEDFKTLNELVASGFRPRWVFVEASRAPDDKPLDALPLSDAVRTIYKFAARTSINLLLRATP